jgi:carbonic anhydrase
MLSTTRKISVGVLLLCAFFLTLSGTLMSQEYENLMKGNERFVKEQVSPKEFGKERVELTKGQHPYAIILSCSDSRVPPEHVFDESLGKLFVIRDAGNVANPEVIGSIEYAVEHLHSKVLVVMGHEKCGAVQAAYDGGHVTHNIESILERIKPSVDKVKETHKDKDAALLEASKENAKAQLKFILENSEIVEEAYKEHGLKLFHAFYNLESGKVDMIEYKD